NAAHRKWHFQGMAEFYRFALIRWRDSPTRRGSLPICRLAAAATSFYAAIPYRSTARPNWLRDGRSAADARRCGPCPVEASLFFALPATLHARRRPGAREPRLILIGAVWRRIVRYPTSGASASKWSLNGSGGPHIIGFSSGRETLLDITMTHSPV